MTDAQHRELKAVLAAIAGDVPREREELRIMLFRAQTIVDEAVALHEGRRPSRAIG
jgi:hypothetical protein